MSAKRTKAPAAADDDIDDLFEGIDNKKSSKPRPAASNKPAPSAKGRSDKPKQDKSDILADLEKDLGEQPSRPQTPRVKDAAKSSKRTSTATPPPGRPSEDKQSRPSRQSVESTRSVHASFTPSATSSDLQDAEKKGSVEQTESAAAAAGGGWWGGIFATATATANAAIQQAGQAYKEIQENEDAKKYIEQVRGNVGALRGFGDELRHRAMPTFADILQTLAPPISSHERLMIHITHDMVGYPALDPMIYDVFSRVMSQVEGGDLLVIQRGQESTARRPSDAAFYRGPMSTAGWRDGPWWRQSDAPRDIGAVKGLVEGTKLCRVSAESYSNEYFASRGGIEEAQRRALEPVSEANPVRTSDIFFAVQAISNETDPDLFAGSTADESEKESSSVADEPEEGTVGFALYLLDPVHEIMYSTMTQELPAKWIRWMDASSPLTPASDDTDQPGAELASVPEEIREIVESGGVDPREWVAEWIEETLMLGVGVLAQRYVARRMGVGEGGFGKGKQKIEALVQEGGSEAARAGLI